MLADGEAEVAEFHVCLGAAAEVEGGDGPVEVGYRQFNVEGQLVRADGESLAAEALDVGEEVAAAGRVVSDERVEVTALTEIPQFCSLKFPTPGRFRT
ncbi:MAG: hypothetical protein LH624_06530 [Cryobacterium sp.]|nr:hypothetical protein [Cryobacterium sp.]